MNCRTVKDTKGREFELTENEEKYIRAIERIERMDSGRVELFANGRLHIRINGNWYENELYPTSIICDGGDGGDNS
jgi:hypothetical protein